MSPIDASKHSLKPGMNTAKLHEASSSAMGHTASHFSAQNNKQESDWKRQLIEHDIRLQNAKLQMIEL